MQKAVWLGRVRWLATAQEFAPTAFACSQFNGVTASRKRLHERQVEIALARE
jgi:hypothetical protein